MPSFRKEEKHHDSLRLSKRRPFPTAIRALRLIPGHATSTFL